LTIVVCGGAFWKGGREEQLAAGALLVDWALTIALRDRSWIGTQWAAFAADLGLLAVVTGISMRTRRYWPLAAASFMLLCVMIHVGRMIDPGVMAWAYATGQVIFTQLFVVAIGVGVWGTWRADRQLAADDAIAGPGATRR